MNSFNAPQIYFAEFLIGQNGSFFTLVSHFFVTFAAFFMFFYVFY